MGHTTQTGRASCRAASRCTTRCCPTALTPMRSRRRATSELRPRKLEGTLAFMFETRFPQRLRRMRQMRELEQHRRALRQQLKKALQSGPALARGPRYIDDLDEQTIPSGRSRAARRTATPIFPFRICRSAVLAGGDPAPRCGVAIADESSIYAAAHRPACSPAMPRPRTGRTTNAQRLDGSWLRPGVQLRSLDLSELCRDRSRRSIRSAETPASARRLHDVSARVDRRLHRLLCRHSSRDECRRQFRPDHPLLPNYKYVPIGYHGRSFVGPRVGRAGSTAQRPAKAGDRRRYRHLVPRETSISNSSSASGFPSNALGSSVPIAERQQHVAGYCLLNDWSARDIQGWEYQPLGPFLAKSFFYVGLAWWSCRKRWRRSHRRSRTRPDGYPAPLPYLYE